MTALINLTPHPVQLLPIGAGRPRTFPPRPREEGGPARIAEQAVPAGRIQVAFDPQFSVVAVSYGEVTGLPDPDPLGAVCYVVSRMVADACRDLGDLYFPMDVVRDGQGQILYARSLGRVAR